MRNKDVIERRYLQLKLSRDRRKADGIHVQAYIESLKDWLKSSVRRTKKKGGLGK